MEIWQSISSSDLKLTRTVNPSAAATAMVKCAQIKGLADQTDPTCLFSFLGLIMTCFQILMLLRELVSTVSLVVWTK